MAVVVSELMSVKFYDESKKLTFLTTTHTILNVSDWKISNYELINLLSN